MGGVTSGRPGPTRFAARISDAEISLRRPVWAAISELFLDTSLDSKDVERIARELAKSPYSLHELDNILLWEVYPACRSNLFSIAGEWTGFDLEWLQRRILRGPSWFMFFWATTLGRVSLHSSLTWRRIKRLLRREREREA